MKENKYICIWYSWGEVESPVKVPEDKDAFDYMVELALKEVGIVIVEESKRATIWTNEDDNGNTIIVLNYGWSDDYCYYKIFDNEEEADKFMMILWKMKSDISNIS